MPLVNNPRRKEEASWYKMHMPLPTRAIDPRYRMVSDRDVAGCLDTVNLGSGLHTRREFLPGHQPSLAGYAQFSACPDPKIAAGIRPQKRQGPLIILLRCRHSALQIAPRVCDFQCMRCAPDVRCIKLRSLDCILRPGPGFGLGGSSAVAPTTQGSSTPRSLATNPVDVAGPFVGRDSLARGEQMAGKGQRGMDDVLHGIGCLVRGPPPIVRHFRDVGGSPPTSNLRCKGLLLSRCRSR